MTNKKTQDNLGNLKIHKKSYRKQIKKNRV